MTIPMRSKAKVNLAATPMAENPALSEAEEAQRQRAQQVAELRARRLAREAADKSAIATKAEARPKRPLRLPQAHRQQS
jgi:hypothetical protein